MIRRCAVVVFFPLLWQATGVAIGTAQNKDQPPVLDKRPFSAARNAAAEQGKWLIINAEAEWFRQLLPTRAARRRSHAGRRRGRLPMVRQNLGPSAEFLDLLYLTAFWHSKLQEFSVHPRSAPQRIRFRHPPNKLPDLAVYSRPA